MTCMYMVIIQIDAMDFLDLCLIFMWRWCVNFESACNYLFKITEL